MLCAETRISGPRHEPVLFRVASVGPHQVGAAVSCLIHDLAHGHRGGVQVDLGHGLALGVPTHQDLTHAGNVVAVGLPAPRDVPSNDAVCAAAGDLLALV